MSSISRQVSPPLRSLKRKRSLELGEASRGRNGITLYSWNVNSCQPLLQPLVSSYFANVHVSSGCAAQEQTRTSLRRFLAQHGWPTFLLLQEMKIAPDDESTKRAVERAVGRPPNEPQEAPDYKAHFCLPNDRYNARAFGGKLYGVCTVIRADFQLQYVEKIRTIDWDREGRVLIIETRARGRVPKLAIINIYAVNGTNHPYQDPDTGRVIGTRHDRKLQFHAHLQEDCRQLEVQGFAVIVAGDINVARSALDGHPKLRTFPKQHCLNRDDFEARFLSGRSTRDVPAQPYKKRSKTLAADLDLHQSQQGEEDTSKINGLAMIDTFRHLHPTTRAYTYYPRTKEFGDSCDRVDMILISQTLERNLVEADMHQTAHDRASSDHVPLYARLDFDAEPD